MDGFEARRAALDAAVRFVQPGAMPEVVVRMARVFEMYLLGPSEVIDNSAITVPTVPPPNLGASFARI